MIQIQKILKRIGLTFVFIFASILLIVQIPILNTSLTQSLLNVLLPPNYHVSISKIQGSFPFDIKIQTINLFDNEGKWGQLEDLEYSWRGINLLFGNVHFDRLAIKAAQFNRIPSFFSENPLLEGQDVFIKALPKKIPHVNIDRFHIEQLTLPPFFLPNDKKFSILGELSSDYSNNHSIACFISHIDHANETTDFITLVSKIEKDKVVITAHVDEKINHFLEYFKKENLFQGGGDISAKIKIITERSFSDIYMSARTTLNNLLISSSDSLPLLEKELSFRIKVIKEGHDSKIKINQITLRTDRGAYLTGGFVYDWNTTDFMGNLNLTVPFAHNYFNNENKILKGSTSAQSSVSGSINGKKAKFSLTVNETSVNNSFDALVGNLDFQWLTNDRPFGVLSLEAKQREGITTLGTALWADKFPLLTFRDIEIKGPKTDIKGLFNLNANTLLYDGQLLGAISDLSIYTQWVGQPIKGKLQFNLNKSQEKCNLSVVISDLWLKKMAAEHISIEAQLKELEPEHLGIKAKNFFFNFASLGFDTIDLDLSGQKKNKIFSFKGSRNGKRLLFTGEIESKKEGDQTVFFKTFNINDEKETLLFLEKPAFLEINSLHHRLMGVNLKSKNGFISIPKFEFSSLLSGTAEIKAFPLDFLFIFNDKKLFTGAVDGKITIDGPLENPTLDLWLRGGARDTSTKFGKKGLAVKVVSCDFKAHQKNNILTFETSLASAKQLSLKGGGNINTNGFLKGTDSLTARFNLQGNLSALNSFILVNDRFSGQVEGAFDLKGVLESPLLTGKLSIKNGVFEDSEMGTVLQGLTAQADIKDSLLRLSTCTCHDFSKGKAGCSGFIDFKTISAPLVRLDAEFNNYVIVNKDDFTAKATGKLALKTQDKGHILVSGDIDILKGEYILQDTPETHKIIKVHEDPHLIKNFLQKEYAADYQKGIFILNINTHFQNYFYIYGFGLKSQWNGRIAITGNADRSRLNGTLNLVKGTLMVANKSMILSQGAISFDGEKDKDPAILMVATREVSGFETFFRVEGKASNSAISVGAIPSLTQNQALSLILFGKPLNNITPAQSVQLALAMGNLKSSRGQGFADTLGQTFGFDTLSLEQDETTSSDPDLSPGYKVRLGKQLNDYIYLGLSQGFSKEAGTNGVLEADITKNTKIQLSAGTGERSNSVSYMWEKKY